MKPPAELEGVLLKQNPHGIGKKSWKKRYFKVIGSSLHYHESKGSDSLGFIPFLSITEVHPKIFSSVPKKEYVNCGFDVVTKGRTYHLLAESPKDAERWVEGLQALAAFWAESRDSADTDDLEEASLEKEEDTKSEYEIESGYSVYGEGSDSDASEDSSTQALSRRDSSRSVTSLKLNRPNRSNSSSVPRASSPLLISQDAPPTSANTTNVSTPPSNGDSLNGHATGDQDGKSKVTKTDSSLTDPSPSSPPSSILAAPKDSMPSEKVHPKDEKVVSFDIKDGRTQEKALGSPKQGQEEGEEEEEEEEEGLTRTRSQAMGSSLQRSSSATSLRSNDGSKEPSLSGVKVWMDDGSFHSTTLPANASVSDLLTKLTRKMDAALAKTLSLWEVSPLGVCTKLEEGTNPHDTKKRGSRLFLLSTDRKLLVLFFEDGTSIPVVVPFTASTSYVLNNTPNKTLSDKIESIKSPGLFLRLNGRDQLFHDDDCPLDAFYLPVQNGDRPQKEQSAKLLELGKLVVKSTALSLSRVLAPIKSEPLPDVSLADEDDVVMVDLPTNSFGGNVLRGYLFKKGSLNSAWQKRWCVFADGVLKYYKNIKDREPAGQILSSEMTAVYIAQEESNKNARYPYCFEVATNSKRDFMFCAESSNLMLEWVNALEACIRAAIKVGYLYKRGYTNQAWRRRWFVFTSDDLSYYEDQGEKAKKGSIDLEKITEIKMADEFKDNCTFVLLSPDRTYYLRCNNMQETREWINALKGVEKTKLVSEEVAVISDPSIIHEEDEENEEEPLHSSTKNSTINTNGNNSNSNNSYGNGNNNAGYGGRKPANFGRQGSNQSITSPLLASPPPLFQPPPPSIPIEESRSTEFADLDWSVGSSQPTPLSPALEEVMGSQADPLSRLFETRPNPMATKLETHLDDLKAKAKADDEPIIAPFRNPTEADLKRLGLVKKAPNPLLKTSGGPVNILSPSVLKLALLQTNKVGETSSSSSSKAFERICLSGVNLRHRATGWELEPGNRFHSPLAHDPDDHVETFTLPPNMKAQFSHAQKKWFVTKRSLSSVSFGSNLTSPSMMSPPLGADYSSQPGDMNSGHPNASLRGDNEGDGGAPDLPQRSNTVVWMKKSGLRFSSSLQAAIEKVLLHYSSGQLHSDKVLLLDDSKNEAIGILIRSTFCTSVAEILAHGLVPTRLAGLQKVSIWDLIVAACPTPSKSSSVLAITAFRAVKDLQSNPNMLGDNNIKFRSFVCASLNHHFLEDFLRSLFNNTSLLQKYYLPEAFLRTCPSSVYDQMLLGLQPLMVLPFRLFTSFELRVRARTMTSPTRNNQFAPSTQNAHPAQQSTFSRSDSHQESWRSGTNQHYRSNENLNTANPNAPLFQRLQSDDGTDSQFESPLSPRTSIPYINDPHKMRQTSKGSTSDQATPVHYDFHGGVGGGYNGDDLSQLNSLNDQDNPFLDDFDGANFGNTGVDTPVNEGEGEGEFQTFAGYMTLVKDIGETVVDEPQAPPPEGIQRVVALYSNEAEDDDELSFQKGDIMTVDVVLNDEWYTCTLNGRQGMVASNYVQLFTEM